VRADARRNRRRLLDAAVELLLELGVEPSRDAVARRADVGIGTLYRHFPDQPALLRAVALDVLDRTIERGEAALAGSPDGGAALRRYLHDAIDAGLGVLPIVVPLLGGADWPDRRDAAQALLQGLADAARRDGAVGADVDADEIALATIRFCRPLAIGLDPVVERTLAHRHLDIFLDGLAADARPRGPTTAT
jgi:AcrR family transcriptional regulator